jgi:hypothetical protein
MMWWNLARSGMLRPLPTSFRPLQRPLEGCEIPPPDGLDEVFDFPLDPREGLLQFLQPRLGEIGLGPEPGVDALEEPTDRGGGQDGL